MLRTNIGDLRRTDGGAVLQVRGKGDKDRRIPVEAVPVDVLQHYLDSRKIRFPNITRRSSPTGGLAGWPADAPLFVGGDGQRITRGALQYRVLRASRQAGIDGTHAKGALLHGLRHTFATELANADEVSVYTLNEPAGPRIHGHFTALRGGGAGTETRAAASQNRLCGLLQHASVNTTAR
jgi:integrase/recombinase XerC